MRRKKKLPCALIGWFCICLNCILLLWYDCLAGCMASGLQANHQSFKSKVCVLLWLSVLKIAKSLILTICLQDMMVSERTTNPFRYLSQAATEILFYANWKSEKLSLIAYNLKQTGPSPRMYDYHRTYDRLHKHMLYMHLCWFFIKCFKMMSIKLMSTTYVWQIGREL